MGRVMKEVDISNLADFEWQSPNERGWTLKKAMKLSRLLIHMQKTGRFKKKTEIAKIFNVSPFGLDAFIRELKEAAKSKIELPEYMKTREFRYDKKKISGKKPQRNHKEPTKKPKAT